MPLPFSLPHKKPPTLLHLLPPLKSLLPPFSRPSSSSSSQNPTPSIGSAARIRKLISSQSDPLLAKEIHDLASSLLPSSSLSSLPVLILKLARAGKFSHSLSLLRRLPSPLSPSLFSSLSLTFSQLSRPDLNLFLLQNHHSTLQLLPSKHLNRLLSALSAHPSSLPAALSLLKSSPSPTVRSFNILILAFCRNNKLSTAYSLFNRMFKLNLSPDTASYRILMQGLCRKSQVGTAAGLLEDMLNKGFVPDALSYTSLLNSLCRKKRFREAYKMLCRMKVKGCNPDIIHYNTVIVGFCREDRPLDACKVIEDMPDNGCLPNLVSYTTLINGLCGSGLLEMANGYLEEMVGKGLVPHFSVFHGLIKGFRSVGKLEEACGVLEVMLRQGVSPHSETWVLVVAGVCDDDREKLEEVLLRVVKEEEWRRGMRIVKAGHGLEEYIIRRMRR